MENVTEAINNASTNKRVPPRQEKIRTSPFEVRTMSKLPAELENNPEGKGKRTRYPWATMKKRGFIEVPAKLYQSALSSAKGWADRQNAEKDASEHVVFASMAATDEKGEVPKQPVMDKDGNPVLNKDGSPKMEASNYWIIRTK